MRLPALIFALTIGLVCNLASTANAEGWSWNPVSWFSKSVSTTSSAVKSTTVNTWGAMSRGTSAAWHKTTEILDPYPNKPPKKTTRSSDDKPETIGDFLQQERYEY